MRKRIIKPKSADYHLGKIDGIKLAINEVWEASMASDGQFHAFSREKLLKQLNFLLESEIKNI